MYKRSLSNLQIIILASAMAACGSTKRFDRSVSSTNAAAPSEKVDSDSESKAAYKSSQDTLAGASADLPASGDDETPVPPIGKVTASSPAAAVPPVAVGGAFLNCFRLPILEPILDPLSPIIDTLAPVIDNLTCQIEDETGDAQVLPRETVVTFTFVALNSTLVRLPLAATRSDSAEATTFLIVAQKLGIGEIVAAVDDGQTTQELKYQTSKLDEGGTGQTPLNEIAAPGTDNSGPGGPTPPPQNQGQGQEEDD